MIHLVFGTVLAITILRPLSQITPDLWIDSLSVDSESAEFYIEEGEKEALKARKECIENALTSYIFDKAQVFGSELAIHVTLDENLVPVFMEMKGYVEPDVQMQIQTILAKDLGIPKENQKWILHPESNNS